MLMLSTYSGLLPWVKLVDNFDAKYKVCHCLKVPLETVICVFDTLDNNLEMNDFTNYLKEKCKQWSEKDFPIKYFLNLLLPE